MAYNPAALAELASTDIFTLWYYTTTDTRTQVLATGYFSADATRLQPGHLIICQTSDAMAFLPVRISAAVGSGLVVDANPAALQLNVSAAPRYAYTLSSVTPTFP